MPQLDSKPEIVGREEELKRLRENLKRASEGQGGTLFILGEAGIGKTRLLEEIKSEASSKGFGILSGNSLHESLTPYMPFLEALRSGGLEFLFAEETPKVEAAYLVTNAGLLVKEVLREETELDPDMFASMLTTVGNFVKDSLSMLSGEEKKGTLNILGYEDHRILIESGVSANLVVILTGKENEFLINDMKETLLEVDKKYGGVLKEWDGDEASVSGIEELLKPAITSGKYDGIYYWKEDPMARRNLLFENVSLGLIRQARMTPVLLCIEDLQWADPSTLALMHYVARNTRRCSLLILGTYRPEDIPARGGKSHPLSERIRLMSHEDLYEEMELQRLLEKSIPEILTSLLKEVDFSSEFKHRIFRETEGNPLFIVELVKLMVDEEVIRVDKGIWKLAKDLKEVYIPSKIHDVIVRRLDRLQEGEREILDYGAVIGEEFTSNILSRATELNRVQLLKQLRKLEQTHKLVNSLDTRYKFDHAMIKEVLYTEIPTELRREYHSIIAHSIEELHKEELDDVIGDLAFHYYRCRDAEKAIPYLLRAAEKAKEKFASKEAIRFCNEALGLIGEDRKRLDDRLKALGELGDVYELTGEYDNAIQTFEEIRKISEDEKTTARTYRKIGNVLQKKGEYEKALEELSEGTSILEKEKTAELGRIVALRGVVYMRKGNYDDALEHCRSALEIFEEYRGETKDVADASSTIGTVHWYKGDYDKALEYYVKSLQMREKIGDQRGIAMVLNNIGNVDAHRGEYDRALEHYEKSLEIAEKIGDQRGIAMLLNNIGNVHAQRGEFDRALQDHGKSLAIREKIGDLSGMAASLGNIGNVYRTTGECDRALEYYEKSLEIAEKIGDQRGVVMSLNNIGSVHKDREEYDRALEYYEKSLEIAEKIGDQWTIALLLSNIGSVHKGREEYDRALEYYERSLQIREKIGDLRGATSNHCGIAEIYLAKRDLEKALDFCSRTLDMSEEIGVKENIGNSRRIFGMIYSKQGKWDLAAESFEESIRIFKEIGTDRQLGESFYEFGLMRKERGDTGRAKENLEKAAGIFEKLKLERELEKVKAALGNLA